jgi:transcriptional regulator with XRE-family HTH domain
MKRTTRHQNAPVQPANITAARQQISSVITRAFASHTDPNAAYADPNALTRALHDIIDSHFAPPSPSRKFSPDQIADEIIDRIALVERPITRQRVRAMQRRVKKHLNWSAREMADYLGCDRSTLKKIQSGARTPSEKFIRHFRYLEKFIAGYLIQQRERDREIIKLQAAFPLPARITIRRKPIQCQRCKNYFEPARNGQKFCGCKTIKGK